eukprot:CAMPEP_0181220442 /NCGR_PEP_ID=MMETSP1096-20121128/28841_1 /TAXON_ID=156174 ORGANISM="Chrysochromulina ericina, Strain CCMP281" /NCGR_SAMPLE_ID=MMETSP1096 /ASSEMBLY_ACC=CAM_ASM_000453 /LENGTH=69 /DNA_ID=CAMNT_0023312949 /DNA_START=641 /DNA_END=846 /DNA_ORIENTATION=+
MTEKAQPWQCKQVQGTRVAPSGYAVSSASSAESGGGIAKVGRVMASGGKDVEALSRGGLLAASCGLLRP